MSEQPKTGWVIDYDGGAVMWHIDYPEGLYLPEFLLVLNAMEAKLTALEAVAGELYAAGEVLRHIVNRVVNNATLDSDEDPTWFDDRDAAVSTWATALAHAREAGIPSSQENKT